MELTDDEYEIVVFAVRVARVQQIQSVDALRSTLRAAFPTTEDVSINRAVKYLGNRLVASSA